MLDAAPQSAAADAPQPRTGPDDGGLLTGDLGMVMLAAVLECGVGWVVSSWQERPTPIDAAIADAADGVLARRGVLLRRLRGREALRRQMLAPGPPAGGVSREPARGLVVLEGRRGLRAAVEDFSTLEVPGAVVIVTYDEDVARAAHAIVVDPIPTAPGLLDAMSRAYAASRLAGRPVAVVVRERTLGMRGTVRRGVDLAPVRAAELDAASESGLPLTSAIVRAGLVRDIGIVPAAAAGANRPHDRELVVAAAQLAGAVVRGLEAAAVLAAADRRSERASVAARVVSTLVPTVSPLLALTADGTATTAPLADADRVLVVAGSGTALAAAVGAGAPAGAPVTVAHASFGSVLGGEVVSAVAAWLVEGGAPPSVGALATSAGPVALDPAVLVPRRDERLHRAVTPAVAAALELAQGVVGVPSRLHDEWPTWRTQTGAALSVVPATMFAEHGLASAAPDSGHNVFVVLQPGSADVVGAAARAGATVEFTDAARPRPLAAAIARACRDVRLAPHVIVATDVQHVAGSPGRELGVDAVLLGTDRISVAAVPASELAIDEVADELVAGPVAFVRDTPSSHAALPAVHELSGAFHDVRVVRRLRRSRTSAAAWSLRRRLLRGMGVDA